ncbi:hypothetical protein HY029_02890 [Candidatus Gottesmanbacteria bacterium]|nr:hypothetical protein [Candidatus Gottesmanbacteria bacterium]
MKIKFDFKDNKNNPTKQAEVFIAFLNEGKPGNEIKVLSPEKILGRGPDYFIPNTGLLIEATQLIDNKDLARNVKWSLTVNTLSKLIKESAEFSSIKGLYTISTPENFGLKASQLKNESILNTRINNAVDILIQAIISGKTEIEVFNTKLKIEKINEDNNGVYFSTIGQGSFINVAGIFHENLKDKFNKANEQLAIKKINQILVNTRILLIVNRYRLLAFDWDLFEGLSYSYKDLVENYKNIDEIWFQTEDGKGKYHHKILYRKSLFIQFEDMNFSNMSSRDYDIFAKWFSALEKLDEKKKQSLIEALKILLSQHKPYEIFHDSQTRIEMVRYGRWLAENGKREEANWLANQFLDDPDPLDPPSDDKENYGNQLNKSIENATKPDTHAIHTVKGHLAWTVQLLTLNKDFLKEAYDKTQSVLRSTKHLYLILQWIFPLIEISNRRFWLKELDENKYKDFKKLCFELLDSYANYPDIAKGLVRVFNYFKELSSEEAKRLLDKLEDSDDYETLLIYFAIYRNRHFKEEKYNKEIRDYKPDYAMKKLNSLVLNNDKRLLNLRSGIAWNIWKILSDNDKEFKTLSPFIDQFLTTTYENHLYHNFERIVETCIDKHPIECIKWFVRIIESANTYLAQNPEEGRNIWLGSEIGKVLNIIAKKKPDKLLCIIPLLSEMWLKGAFIGTISEVFTSYKAITIAKLKTEAKKRFKEYYAQMKAVNPKLQEVDWRD